MYPSTRRFPGILLAILGLWAFPMGGMAPAAATSSVASVPAEQAVTADELNASIKEVEAAQDMEEGLKGKLVELYRQALRQLERLRSNESSARAYEEARKTAPNETQALRKKLEESEPKPVTLQTLKITDKTSLSELEQRLVKEKANLTALEAKLSETEKALDDEKTRPDLIRDRLTELKQGQTEIEKEP